MRSRGKCFIDVAAPQPEIKRDVGSLAALEVLEVGKGASWL